ncbi:hypothetical protein JS756_35135 [Streptomyces actuosus]|uniref:Uncharacterized protein n=1 Tax=Streptomyces actuosus TaxID=1885 RepID=A0ABS2W1C6_STRAS|nr:hypothetical protein [Streptomyces actuosus]MBN0049211.1 hypothetical protein [Streptomyces actuosus]
MRPVPVLPCQGSPLTSTLLGAAGLRALSAAQSIGPGKLLRMAPSRLVVTAGALVGGAVVCLAVGVFRLADSRGRKPASTT